MIYVDLPPVALADLEPTPDATAPDPSRRPRLAPKRAWRREGLLKHLLDPVVVAETAGLLQQQTDDIHTAFKPRNGWQDWLTGTIATIMLRINRSERIERKLRDWASYRAIDFWEDDQALAVATLAGRIGKDPAKVVAQLRETPAGIDWLVARWQFLAGVDPVAWTDAHRDLAACLVGGHPTADPARPGFALDQVAGLEAYRDRVVEADAITRGLVEADLADDLVPGLARLRRYVRSLQRQLKWYVDQFHVEHPDRWDDPRRRPAIYGPAVEPYRPRNPNQFEGRPDPICTETNPMPGAAAEPVAAETKPLSPYNDKTKPSGCSTSTQSAATSPPAAVLDYATERGKHHSRTPRAGEPSREYARTQKAARRRTNRTLPDLN